MERGFQSLLLNGKYTVDDDVFSPEENSDEAHRCREMKFQYETSLISSLHYPCGSSYDHILDGSIRRKKIDESSREYGKRRCVEKEGKPKNELSTELLNFTPANMFSHLPELRSMEQVKPEERRLKQKFSPTEPTTTQHILEPMVTKFQLTANYFAPAPVLQPLLPPPAKVSYNDCKRKKRNTLSEKTRSLEKVLPWDKKMDMATIYEETFKYINFLKAQISVLESMPVVASPSSSNFGSGNPRFCTLKVAAFTQSNS